MKVYTARQPILNAKKKVVAYELLFRDCKTNSFPMHVPPDTATAKLLVESYASFGLENITQGKPVFINFPEQMLAEHLVDMVPFKNIVIEVLEDTEPNDKNFALMRKLFHQRHVLALDDFIYKPAWERFLPFIKLVKLDIQQTPLNTLPTLLVKLRNKKIKLLAEKVQTHEEFEQAKSMGFHFYQGNFLLKPEMMESTDIESAQQFLLSIYAEVMKDDFSYNILEGYFQKDMGLTYKLLRFVNSNLFNIKREINSLKQAMVFLGETQLRKFICLIVMAQLNPQKPTELIESTVVRARLCELIAKAMGLSNIADAAFLTGLFSTIDAILDRSLDTILESLPLAPSITDALLRQQGELAECLKVTLAYINGDWDTVFAFIEQYNISPNELLLGSKDAYNWVDVYQKTVE